VATGNGQNNQSAHALGFYLARGSFADGKTLSEVLAKTNGRMRADRIQRTESLFLAKLLGMYMLIVAALWVVRGDVLSKVIDESVAIRPLLFLSGLLALVVGIALVISHSVWELNWRGLIALLGYGFIAKGIARIDSPSVVQKAAGSQTKDSRIWCWIGLVFAIGGYPTWVGFTHG